jgi:hypothetical protein
MKPFLYTIMIELTNRTNTSKRNFRFPYSPLNHHELCTSCVVSVLLKWMRHLCSYPQNTPFWVTELTANVIDKNKWHRNKIQLPFPKFLTIHEIHQTLHHKPCTGCKLARRTWLFIFRWFRSRILNEQSQIHATPMNQTSQFNNCPYLTTELNFGANPQSCRDLTFYIEVNPTKSDISCRNYSTSNSFCSIL